MVAEALPLPYMENLMVVSGLNGFGKLPIKSVFIVVMFRSSSLLISTKLENEVSDILLLA